MIMKQITNIIKNGKLIKFELLKNNKIIGTANIGLDNIDKNTTTIRTLYIENQYRNKGYGSSLLEEIEKNVKMDYNIKNVNLLAFQTQGSTEVIDFFKKNGYNEINTNEKDNTYDDYDTIYDLIQFQKKV